MRSLTEKFSSRDWSRFESFPFGLSQFDDDVAVLEALHDAVHDLADVLVVFGVNALAFGFADLLEDDLLGRLRGDAAQAHRGFQEFDFLVHLGIGLGFASFIEGDFTHGIGDFLDDLADREHVDFTSLRIDSSAELFVGLEVFAGCDDDRVLNRVDHDLRIDAFFPADLVDRLKKQIRHPNYSLAASGHSNSKRAS